MAEVYYEKDTTFNFNTPEAKIAKEVAIQFVNKRTGKIMKNSALKRETEVMLLRVAEIEPKQGEHLKNLVNSINLTEENGYRTFLRLSDEIFNGQICWGRIVTFFLYTALSLEHLKKSGKDTFNDKIALWLGICIARQSHWIKESGGWQAFVTTMGGPKELQETLFNGLFNVTLGLGTIAAALYIQGR